MTLTRCHICHAPVPDVDGPVSEQLYLPQSPGCWKLYTEVLAREFGEWQYPEIHRLTVDAYAAQHPTPEPDPKSAQSVALHALNLYLATEGGHDNRKLLGVMRQLLAKHKGEFAWLTPPEDLGEVTIADVHRAETFDEHVEVVRAWARSVWEAWSEHHPMLLGYLAS